MPKLEYKYQMQYHHKLLLSVAVAHVLTVIGLIIYWDPVMLITGYLIGSFIFVTLDKRLAYTDTLVIAPTKLASGKKICCYCLVCLPLPATV